MRDVKLVGHELDGATDADLAPGRGVRFALGADDQRERKPIVTRLMLAEEAVSRPHAKPAHHRWGPLYLRRSKGPDTIP